VRRTAAVTQTALAGVMLERSLARFRPSMATFSEETTPSRSPSCLGSPFMVRTQGGLEGAGCVEASEPRGGAGAHPVTPNSQNPDGPRKHPIIGLIRDASLHAPIFRSTEQTNNKTSKTATGGGCWLAAGIDNGRTLGFALAKGLIRGLTRCPNPSLRI